MGKKVMHDRYANEKIGMIAINNRGTEMKIVKYENSRNITVEFLDKYGFRTNARYQHFKNGQINNPYDKTVYNIGYIGVGNHKIKESGNKTKAYIVWRDMIKRCYAKEYLDRRPTYKNCTVCDEWHNFQNFGDWFDKNYYEINGEATSLDKDILSKGNKVYSPKTCIFVPKSVNSLFAKSDGLRGELPIGVSLTKSSGNYASGCNNQLLNKTVKIGTFSTPELAFQAYKEYKEAHIKEVADHYKDKIPKKLYDAMYKYEVEITD